MLPPLPTTYDPKELMRWAYYKAKESPDPSTQNSAVIVQEIPFKVLVAAVNRFPEGVQYLPERWERPAKYKFIEHAERNAVFLMAEHGLYTKGCIMISPWACCSDCARAIIQSGIKKLVTHKQAGDRSPPFWREEIDVAYTMLTEAGVELELLDCIFDGEIEIRHSGEIWKP